jgi:hypothetical protein
MSRQSLNLASKAISIFIISIFALLQCEAAPPAQAEAARLEPAKPIERSIEQLEGRIRESSPQFAALIQPVPLKLEEVQQKVLDSDTLLLEYSLGEQKSLLWAVTSDSIRSYELPKRP